MATVDDLIFGAQFYAGQTASVADSVLSRTQLDLANMTRSFGSDLAEAYLPASPAYPKAMGAPSLVGGNPKPPYAPNGDLELDQIDPLEPGDGPTLSASMPVISIPSLPSQLAQFQGTVPAINTDYDFPVVPQELVNPLPIAPVSMEHVIPIKPTVGLPSFDAISPTNNTVAPTDLDDQFNAAYRDIAPTFVAAINGQLDVMLTKYNPQYHTQMAAIETQLSKYLAGGTGLDQAVETAIYTRSTSKQAAEGRRTRDAAWEEMASRGHTIPGGTMAASIRRSRQAESDNNAAAAREIVVMQAEYEQKNLQFAVSTSAGLRQSMLSAALSYHQNMISINGQALDYAKSILGAVVETYNISVKDFEARVNALRAETAVYEARLKGAMYSIDLYKAEIDALQAMVQVDQTKVAMYRGRIDALQSLATVYKTRIEAVVEEASLEKLKLELFKTNVDIYVAQVQGKRAEYDGYTAAIKGNDAMVGIYTAQVGAYSAQTMAYKATIEGKAEVIKAKAISNRAKADQHIAKWDAYKIQIAADSSRTDAEIKMQQGQLNLYDSQARANIQTAQLGATIYKAHADVILENAKATNASRIAGAAHDLERAKAIAQIGTGIAGVWQGMASAALSGMNTLVAQSVSE